MGIISVQHLIENPEAPIPVVVWRHIISKMYTLNKLAVINLPE